MMSNVVENGLNKPFVLDLPGGGVTPSSKSVNCLSLTMEVLHG